jgi:hypothetical protein
MSQNGDWKVLIRDGRKYSWSSALKELGYRR